MSANFKSVEEEINNSLNNMDNEDSSGSSSNTPEASADDTLNLTTEKFTIKYTKHTITKDFAGNPCIMVYYDYTNNSSSASSAMVDVSLKATSMENPARQRFPRIMTMRSIILQLRFSPDRPLMYARHLH